MSEQNKALTRRAVEEVWNRGNYAVVDELVAGDFVVHATTLTEEIRGPEGVRRYFGALRAGFPDLHVAIEDQIAEGDRVVTRWTARGTHTGAFQGISPTGARVRVTGIDIDRIADGKFVECWTSLDELGLLQQLGVVPTPERVER
jgi:steroid delta-isomerase-like uncharacterized protein